MVISRAIGAKLRAGTASGGLTAAVDTTRASSLARGRPDGSAGGGYGGPYGPNVPYGFGGFPAQVVEYSCETTFQIVQDRVLSFTFRGNACG